MPADAGLGRLWVRLTCVPNLSQPGLGVNDGHRNVDV